MAVQDGRDLAGATEPPGSGAAGGPTGFGDEGDLGGHDGRAPGRGGTEPRDSRRSYERLSPPKISDTDVSSNTASSASATMRATDSTSILSMRRSSGSGRVSVTTTRLMTEFLSR